MQTVAALDDVRPPEKTLALSLFEDGEETELDEPIPMDELGENPHWGRCIPSMSDRNEEGSFGIAHLRFGDENAGGIVKVLAPGSFNGDYFDTWQEAEAYIAEHFEQPEPDNELIQPLEAAEIQLSTIAFSDDDDSHPDWVNDTLPDDPFANATDP